MPDIYMTLIDDDQLVAYHVQVDYVVNPGSPNLIDRYRGDTPGEGPSIEVESVEYLGGSIKAGDVIVPLKESFAGDKALSDWLADKFSEQIVAACEKQEGI